jgi:hypothetical protein
MIRTIAAALAAFVFVAFGARADEPAPKTDTKAEKPAKKAKKSKKSKKGAEKPADAAAPAAK